MPDLEVDSYEFLPLREVVYLTLRKAILKSNLKPGERLMENTIANKIGVSRTPVREAIRMLEQEGLVEMVPRKGAHVANISRQDLNDVLEIRKSLEELAVTKACGFISPEEIKELKMSEFEFEKVLRGREFTAIAQADEKFHDVIFKAARNQKLITILNNLREQMYRFRLEYLKQDGVLELITQEHNAIVATVSKRDVKKAGLLIIEHIDNQQKEINQLLSSQEEE